MFRIYTDILRHPPLSTKESTWFVCDFLELDKVPSMSNDCGSLPDVPVQNDKSPNNVSKYASKFDGIH